MTTTAAKTSAAAGTPEAARVRPGPAAAASLVIRAATPRTAAGPPTGTTGTGDASGTGDTTVTGDTGDTSGTGGTGDANATSGGKPAAYRDANVLRWLTGFGVSLLGDHVYFIALTWSAGQVSGAGGAGLVLACSSLPRLVLLLVGGAVADRWDVRRLMLASDTLRCVVMIAAALTTVAASPSLTVLVTVAVVFGMVDAVFLPAVGALPQYLVDPDQYGRMQGLRMVVARGAMVAGAPLGGLTVTVYGVPAAFAVNAVSFAVSVAALAATRLTTTPPCAATDDASNPGGRNPAGRNPGGRNPGASSAGGAGGGLRSEMHAGLDVVAHSPLLRTVLIAMALSEVGFSGPFNVGITLLVQERGWRAAEVGMILGGFGAGAAVAAAAAVVLGRLPRAGLTFGFLIIMMAVSLAAIGYATTLTWAVTAAAFLGVGGGLASIIAITLLQMHTPPGYLGRVMSLTALASLGSTPVSCALTGLLAAAVGSPAAFLVASIVAASGGVAALSTPVLREAELPDRRRTRAEAEASATAT